MVKLLQIFDNKIVAMLVFITLAVTVISYFAIVDAPHPISYKCENGDLFVLEVVNRSQVQITSGTQTPIVLSQESKLDASVTIYGNDEIALTYIDGYGEQAIKTQRQNGALSTICNPL